MVKYTNQLMKYCTGLCHRLNSVMSMRITFTLFNIKLRSKQINTIPVYVIIYIYITVLIYSEGQLFLITFTLNRLLAELDLHGYLYMLVACGVEV